MPEIDENEYAEWKRLQNVAQLIGNNPQAREMLQQAVAIAAPDQAGPEIRIRREMGEKLSGIEKKFDDFTASLAKDREDREAADKLRELETRWSTSRSKARGAGYTDEGLKELEDFMEKNGVADHELAIPAFERLHPPPEPAVTGGSRWNFFDQAQGANDEALKALMEGKDELFLAQQVPAALKEARGQG